MLKKTSYSMRLSTFQMTKVGMLSAITIILGLTGMGFIPLPFAKATIMHIPVIIGAILEGPLIGALVGLIFGLFSIYQNITAPNILSFAFLNPLVSVLPRVLIGITSYYVYHWVSKRLKEPLSIAIGTVIGSLTNTIGVLGMITILYLGRYAAAKNLPVKAAINAILSVAYLNGVGEAIVAVIIVVPIVLAVRKYQKR